MSSPIAFPAADGYPLQGREWRHTETDPARAVVVILPATSVVSRYYHRFADYLHDHGLDVVTFDYRGIGESRPDGPLRRLKASWYTWGEQDTEGALRFAQERFPGQPLDVVGHSVGGFTLGLAPSNHSVRRVFTMGSQFAYWRDYPAELRRGMLLKWHLLQPLLALALGHVPAKRLGWMEDTPRGVALDWATMRRGFEHSFRHRSPRGRRLAAERRERFGQLRAPLLALSVTDDPFGTEPAIERLLDYYTGARRTHLRLSPAEVGVERIGHFAFFHDRFRDSLWHIPLAWLTRGALPEAPETATPQAHEAETPRSAPCGAAVSR